MPASPKLAFVGAGQMAGALIEGLIAAGRWSPSQIHASDVSAERLAALAQRHDGLATSTSNADVVRDSQVVVLSVKPQVFDQVLPEIAPGLNADGVVISIAAGVPTTAIEAQLPEGTRVVRVMPNTPALIGKGAVAIAGGAHARPEDLDLAEELLGSVGMTVRLAEGLLDAVTGLSGSGPAYVFLFLEALADAGVKVGLPRQVALELAVQTVVGSALLVQQSQEHPATLKDMVTSPAGTTIAGLQVLEKAALRATLMQAVDAATQRSRELGEQLAARLAKHPDRR